MYLTVSYFFTRATSDLVDIYLVSDPKQDIWSCLVIFWNSLYSCNKVHLVRTHLKKNSVMQLVDFLYDELVCSQLKLFTGKVFEVKKIFFKGISGL